MSEEIRSILGWVLIFAIIIGWNQYIKYLKSKVKMKIELTKEENQDMVTVFTYLENGFPKRVFIGLDKETEAIAFYNARKGLVSDKGYVPDKTVLYSEEIPDLCTRH